MNLVQQNKAQLKKLPAIMAVNQGLGLKIFGWTPPIGDWIAGAVRYVGGAIAGRVRSIPFVGRAIADEIDSLTELAAQVIETRFTEWGLNARVFDSEGNYIGTELTESEKQILDQWLAVFKPYAENLTQEVVNALALTDTNAMLTGINAVLNKIDAIQDHYHPDITKTPGLSDNALKQRSYVIYQAFSLIVTAITEGLKSKNLNLTTKQVTFPINQYNFMPLFSSSEVTTVTGENYVLAGSGTKPTKPIGGGTDLVTNVPGKVITEPVKVQPVNTGNTTTTNTGGTTTTNTGINPTGGVPATTDNTPATTAANETKKVPNWIWWAVGGLAVYAVGKASGKRKSKK